MKVFAGIPRDDLGKIPERARWVETFATIGTHDEIVDKVKARAGGYATQVGFTLPVENPGDEERLKQKIKEFQAI